MSIQTEITRLQGNISAALDAVAAKGVTVGKGDNSDSLAGLIEQIEVRDATVYQTIIARSVSTLTLPADLPSIGDYAFAFWSGLSAVAFLGTPKSIAGSAFYACPNLTKITVPWAEGAVANAPWGATNATITYNAAGRT